MVELLEIKDLNVSLRRSGKKAVEILDGVDLKISTGEVLALVGESGSGKTTTAMAVMDLLNRSYGYVLKGKVLFSGMNLLAEGDRKMDMIRGKEISMIFQEPLSALHPYITVGEQIEEILKVHGQTDKKTCRQKTIQAMQEVGLPDPKGLYSSYPSQLSGGMKQRIVIAMSIIMRPKLLIADEPTTALDVTTQAQILSLLLELKEKLELSVLLITHDLGVVAETADSIAVMYCGRILEYGPAGKVFKNPSHPYTLGLMKCIPYIHNKQEELYSIPGLVPAPTDIRPEGCVFYKRCFMGKHECRNTDAGLIAVEEGHYSRCPFWKEIINEQSIY